MAGCLRAARSELSFGDSAACWRAACRIANRKWIGAVAGNCTRTCSVAGSHSAVKSQPRKLKGPGAFALPAHAISTKNKHLLVIYSIPARGFTAAVSVFRGTPPPKPLKCKSVSNHLGALISDLWADPTGGMPRHPCAWIRLALSDIIETSIRYHSQTVHLSLPPFTVSFRETKNPAYTG